MAKGVEKGITTRDKGVVVSPERRVPYAPERIHMSKKDAVEAEAKRKDNDLKAKQFRKELETDKPAPAMPEKKKAGRPKRIE